jgi:hypothetical protein
MEEILCFECSLEVLGRAGVGDGGTRVGDVDVEATVEETGMGAGGEIGADGGSGVDTSLYTIFEWERELDDFAIFAVYSWYVVGNLVVRMVIHRFRSSRMKYLVLNRSIPLMKLRSVSRSAVGERLSKCLRTRWIPVHRIAWKGKRTRDSKLPSINRQSRPSCLVNAQHGIHLPSASHRHLSSVPPPLL